MKYRKIPNGQTIDNKYAAYDWEALDADRLHVSTGIYFLRKQKKVNAWSASEQIDFMLKTFQLQAIH